jgi:hypothetical protein
MDVKCTHTKVSLAYPQHRFKPEDLLNFIESTDFTKSWDDAGFDVEDDLLSLQLCIMARPDGDLMIEDTGGLRVHLHVLDELRRVTVYYSFYPEYGVAYLLYADTQSITEFTASQRTAIRWSLASVEEELQRLNEERRSKLC